MYYLTNLQFFDIPLLCYYINLGSSIIFCLSSGDIYLSLGISLSCSFVILSELFSSKLLETFDRSKDENPTKKTCNGYNLLGGKNEKSRQGICL